MGNALALTAFGGHFDAWNNYQEITVETTKVGEDIRFTDAAGAMALAYEVER